MGRDIVPPPHFLIKVALDLPADFKEFLQLLNSKKIKYLVIDGYAVALYGYPRATGDIDIWIAISMDNARKTVAALKEFGFDIPELKETLFLEKGKNIRLGVPPLRIELLTSIDGVEFSKCYKNKKACARYKDLDDMEHL